MAFPVTQPFKRTTKGLRFEDDVLTKSQMLQATDDQYETGYAVIDKDTLEQYVYNANATPSQETGKFVKSSGTSGSSDYSDLTNKPKINNIELNGNKKAEDLEIKTFGRYENEDVYGIHTYTDFFGFKSDKSIQGYGSWGFAYDSSVKDVVMINSEYEPADNHQIQRRLPTREAVNTLLANKQDTLQVTTLPTASATEEGNIYQYVGATDSNYTNGYFYQCVEVTPATDPKTYEWVQKNVQSGDGVPAGGTTGQALVKKSNADGDVEWADQTVIVGSDWGVAKSGTHTVQTTGGSGTAVDVSFGDLGFTSVNDYEILLTSDNQNVVTAVRSKSLMSFYMGVKDIGTSSSTRTVVITYTILAKGYGSIPNGGITGQALVKKSNTDGDVEWKTVSGGGASLTIDTTQVGYGEATISEGGQNLSFTNQNGQGVHIGGISEDGEMVASKTYVDSKSPTIVNEGATFTNAQGNQQMQIRTGGTNSVIIKDTNANGTAEYWSYELPDKDYVDTEIAKRNAVVNFDNEYKTLQIRDVNDSVEFQVVKETSNDYVRVNEYAKDDRGQMQQIFDVNLPTKSYVDSKVGVHMAVGAETRYGTYTDENNVTYQAYTKTIYIPALPSTAGVTTYPMGVTNMKQIISISGVTTDGFVLNAPRQTVSDNITIYQVSKGSQTFSIEVGKDRSSKSAYVTIIYAKNN